MSGCEDPPLPADLHGSAGHCNFVHFRKLARLRFICIASKLGSNVRDGGKSCFEEGYRFLSISFKHERLQCCLYCDQDNRSLAI